MKHFFYFIIFTFVVANSYSQNAFNCNSHEYYLKQMARNPAFKANQEQLEKETELFIKNNTANKSSAAAPAFIIPVVFHIIYTTSYGNISDAQIVDQIAILNKEFNRKQADTLLTPAAFLPVAAPFAVEFRLATIDPDGKCTNGINRVYNNLSNCSFEEDDVKALSYWPSNKYLNIWITQSMHYSNSMDCNGGGYAAFPGGNPLLDGINIRGDLISNIGTAATNSSWGNFKGRYLIHELGHWFNLRHIWGDATCGNDFVADTPPAQASNSGCPNFPRNPSSICPGSTADGEMFTNYMDYTNGPCLNMFTAGQVTRMTACMNSPASGRNNLWTNANLNATGTNNPYTYPVACAANPAVLQPERIIICRGDSAKFVDNSYGGQINSRAWSFSGGNASSLTDSIVKVQYNTVGLYDVVLSITYGGSTKTSTFVNKVQVIDNVANPNYIVPFNDDLENVLSFYSDWVIVNNDEDGGGWQWTDTTSFSGMASARIMNFMKKAPLTNELISPSYDLSAVLNPTLSFRLHYATRITASYDKLMVYISNNCGKSWQQLYSRAGGQLRTIPNNQAASFVPQVGSDEWRLEKANISPSLLSSNVRFKFSFTSGGGNNIFIDDINIDGLNTTNIAKNSALAEIKIFPNPAKETLQINYSQNPMAEGSLEVHDILGKICLVKSINPKEDSQTINVTELKDGVYFLKLKQKNGAVSSVKFIKQSTN